MLGGFLAVIFLTAAIVVVAIVNLSKLENTLFKLVAEEIEEVHAVWQIRNLVTGLEIDLRQILEGNHNDEALEELKRKQQEIKASLQHYIMLHGPLSSENEDILTEVMQRYGPYEALVLHIARLAIEGQKSEAETQYLFTAEGQYGDIQRSLQKLLAYEDKEVAENLAIALDQGRSGRRWLTVLLIAGIILSGALALGITFSLTSPIKKLVDSTRRVAEGDLSSKADVVSKDEIGQLAHRFNEMLERLNKAASDQKRFYADASHELRTPLTVIRGEAEVALRGIDSTENYQEALRNILACAGEMGILVDELLFLARTEAGQIEYEDAPVELSDLLADVGIQSEGLGSFKNVSVHLEPLATATVRGDRNRLRQLFVNLINNAIKYTSSGGDVRLAMSPSPTHVTVTVSDTGIGIPADELPYVFDRFYRGETGKTTQQEGTGLGLSIAQAIVKAHNGEIGLESVPGQGTTISVTLPRQAA